MEYNILSNNYILLISIIIIASGLVGGFINYFLSADEDQPARNLLVGYLLLGIGAAATVPLFLNLTSSTLLIEARTEPVKFFIIAGFCFIFALFSKRVFYFFFTPSNRKLAPVPKGGRRTLPAKAEPKVHAEKKLPERLAGVSGSALRIMRVMQRGNKKGRSLEGLFKDSGLSKEVLNKTLATLMSKGLIRQELNAADRLRLYLTPDAEKLLAWVNKGHK